MMIRSIALAAALAAGVAGLQLKDLPAAVQHGVTANLNGATLKHLSKETEGGKTTYEVETTLDGRSRDFVLDTAGRLVEVEDEMAMDAVPAAVATALGTHGTVKKIESITRGTAVTYEGTVEKNGRKSEIEVDANGNRVKAR